MKVDLDTKPLVCCLICRSIDVKAVEFSKPAVLLCACDCCGKYILRKETFLEMIKNEFFTKNRDKISDLIEDHFRQTGSPLQIISDLERPLVQDAVSIDALLSVCRPESTSVKGPRSASECLPNKKLKMAPSVLFSRTAEFFMRLARSLIKKLPSNIRLGRNQKQVS